MSKPVAVLISDIHYNITTLEVADKCLRQAIDKANGLKVPLIVAGDLHDTKANLRAECVNRMIETFKTAEIMPYVIRGNHDSVNEKSKDHSLKFLAELVTLVEDYPEYIMLNGLGAYLIPYNHDPVELRVTVRSLPNSAILIMHQGIQGSDSGEYIIDKSALSKKVLAGYKVISGHYHRRQTLELPDGGTFDYIGNPYTLGFGEAKDPRKGFQVLYNDGSLEFVPTEVRQHVVVEVKAKEILDGYTILALSPTDVAWVKVYGSNEEIKTINKARIAELLNITQDFRLEFIVDEVKTSLQEQAVNLPKDQLMDKLIESLSSTDVNQKERLKTLWKLLVEN